jgi:glycosyltransferase involved in cell wall biosynthesis
VRPTLKDRFQAEWRLKSLVGSEARVLCFGNLPPLFRLPGKVYLYLQNRYLLDDASLADWPWHARARLTFERWWLCLALGNADVLVVQTNTMRALVNERLRRDPIVAPFLPDTQARGADASYPLVVPGGARSAFLYVASGEPHKNHARLVEAWRLLGEGGVRPPLWLTLDPARYARTLKVIEHTASVHGLNITNFGNVSRNKLQELYGKAIALIYPSTLESYGLPLLEARAAGLPVLAAELDYVRDIVDPDETFNPHSPLSIARAVKRFMRRPEQRLPGEKARDFLDRLMSDDAR